MLLVNFSSVGPVNHAILAETLFAGGMIPLYGQILKLIETNGNFKTLATPNNGLSALFLITSLILNPHPQEGWLAQIGKPLFESCVIYLVFRILFIN